MLLIILPLRNKSITYPKRANMNLINNKIQCQWQCRWPVLHMWKRCKPIYLLCIAEWIWIQDTEFLRLNFKQRHCRTTSCRKDTKDLLNNTRYNTWKRKMETFILTKWWMIQIRIGLTYIQVDDKTNLLNQSTLAKKCLKPISRNRWLIEMEVNHITTLRNMLNNWKSTKEKLLALYLIFLTRKYWTSRRASWFEVTL